MHRHQISQVKMNALRKLFIESNLNTYQAARELKISTVTSWRYKQEFERIKTVYPDRLADMNFYMPEEPKPHRETPLYIALMQVLPDMIKAENQVLAQSRSGKSIMRFIRKAIVTFHLKIFIINGWRKIPGSSLQIFLILFLRLI